MGSLQIKPVEKNDYLEYLDLEKIAWKGTEITPISKEIFSSWIDIFPEGCKKAINHKGKIVGVIASQICNFNPHSHDSQKSFNELTDSGMILRTHNSSGDSIYIVTNSAVQAGAGYKLMGSLCSLTQKMEKKYCLGSCRLPGLATACIEHNISNPNKDFVWTYVQELFKRMPKKDRLFKLDPVLSVLARYPDAQLYDVVKDFLPEHDKQSRNWSCVMGWENPNYK